MVYRLTMSPVSVVLLFVAIDLAQGVVADPATPPTPPAADSATREPADPGPVAMLSPESRVDLYDQFRAFYETQRYEEALPLARRIVELYENDPKLDHELPVAYNNLGATYYQLRDYRAAADTYQKSLELLEMTQGISSRRLIAPLQGLGAARAALGEPATAVALLDRALAVSRRSEGLFNLKQLPLIELAALNRLAINDFAGVERDYLYALKVGEQNYGYADERTLPALLQLAAFYEKMREFIAARSMYLRARDVSMTESSGFNPLAIRSLIGISRTHRLQYTTHPETVEEEAPRDRITGEVVGKTYMESRLSVPAADRTGLKSVLTALEILRAAQDPPRQLLLETLLEIGDWYQSTSRASLALPFYSEASLLFAGDADPAAENPLLQPRLVFYRPPPPSVRSLDSIRGETVVRKIVFSLVVSDAGRPEDIAVISTDMEEGQIAQVRRALERAIYSPRFVDGKAQSTAGVTFTADWYQERQPEPAVPEESTAPGA